MEQVIITVDQAETQSTVLLSQGGPELNLPLVSIPRELKGDLPVMDRAWRYRALRNLSMVLASPQMNLLPKIWVILVA